MLDIMNAKIIAGVLVGVLLVSSVGAAVVLMNKDSNKEKRDTISLDSGEFYFDITTAESLSICTVDDNSPNTTASSKAVGSTAAHRSYGNSISSMDGASYEGYHNELLKKEKQGDLKEVSIYKNNDDMKNESNATDNESNIIYLEKCGSLYLMLFYKYPLADLYKNLATGIDYWFNHDNVITLLVDVNTGKSFPITGVWGGTSFWRYNGTNDVISSMQYMGTYEGEEYFKMNVECNKYCSDKTNEPGTFTNIEGVVAFKSDGEYLTHRNVLVDEEAFVDAFVHKADHMSTELSDKFKMFGYEMVLYKNGIIRYTLNNPLTGHTGEYNQMELTGDMYIRATDGESYLLEDGWEELSGYLCRDVSYTNTYFPESSKVYRSDGSLEDKVYTTEESYQLASVKHYLGCIYREFLDDSTKVYILNGDGTVDILELKKTLEFILTENIFESPIPIMEFQRHHPEGPFYDFQTYDNEIFYESVRHSYATFAARTAIVIIDDGLYAMEGDVMKEYNLHTKQVTSHSIPADSVSKLRVDGNGNLYAEAYASSEVCKLELADGGFKYSRVAPQLMTIKKILTEDSGNDYY